MKWLLGEEHTDRAIALLDDAGAGRVVLVAPPVFPGEVLNALYQQERRRNVSAAQVDDAIRRVAALVVQIVRPDRLLESSIAMARRFTLGATYDAQYLVLAAALNEEFWTADEALIRATSGRFPLIRWIGDYTSVEE